MRTVNSLRTFAATLVVCGLPLSGCSDKVTPVGPPVETPIVVKTVIDASGGTINGPSGAFKLVFPPSSFSSQGQAEVTVAQLIDAPADSRVVPNTVFEIKTDGLTPFRGITLSLGYDPSKIPIGLSEQSLRIYRLTSEGWRDGLVGGTVDVATHSVTVVTGLGVYALRSVPVDQILLYGAQANGAMYVGQTATISSLLYRKTAFDAIDNSPSRPLTWRSSAPAVVGVDASGKLTALTVGTSTITATVEGVSATANVTVLARPTANWNGATDWTTYQGNVSRNAYVNVTADPVVFTERWIKTPDTLVVAYHQLTAGGGRVYASIAEAIGGKRTVRALSPTDGSVLWQKTVAAGGLSNQVTYDGGVAFFTSNTADAFMYALNSSDGSERFRAPFRNYQPGMLAPLIAGSTIVSAASGSGQGGLYGLDRTNGNQVFALSISTANAGPWTPAGASGRVYTTTAGINAYDLATGNLLQRITDARLQLNSTPVIGSTNNLLFTQALSRLVAVDLATQRVAWDVSADNDFPPASGNGVVYSASSGSIVARKETDGTQLWSWKPAAPYTTLRSMVLTNNLLFVSLSTGADNDGLIMAIDLASHLPVWSNSFTGRMSINGDGTLYIAQRGRIAAFNLR